MNSTAYRPSQLNSHVIKLTCYKTHARHISHTGNLGGTRLASGLYKSLFNSGDPALKWVFKYDYTRPDASALQAPVLSGIILHINISADPQFDIAWICATVSAGEWQLQFRNTTSDYEIHTRWMTAADPDLTENCDESWTWVNSGAHRSPRVQPIGFTSAPVMPQILCKAYN